MLARIGVDTAENEPSKVSSFIPSRPAAAPKSGKETRATKRSMRKPTVTTSLKKIDTKIKKSSKCEVASFA